LSGGRVSNEERERLLRIIGLCLAVESKGIDPFEVQVQEVLGLLRKYLPEWKALDDFILDSEALKQVALIVRLQSDWIKRRSSSVFVDPLLIEVKLRFMDTQRLTEVFEKAWQPVVEMEALSRIRVEQAIDYWNLLATMDQRRVQLPNPTSNLGETSLEELMRRKILSKEAFREALNSLWEELKRRVGEDQRVPYWDFVQQPTYEETVRRAYLVSFLITYGYAAMQVNPLEEEIFLVPNTVVVEPTFGKQALTIPISIDRNTWEERAKKK
jgi:hypothetical protein